MFATLPPLERSNQVLEALHNLIGDLPTKADYVALVATTHDVLAMLQIAVNHMPPDLHESHEGGV